MTLAGVPRVRALAFHAGYRCRHAGACCSSGWDIPAEPLVEEGLRAALRAGALGLAGHRASATAGLHGGATADRKGTTAEHREGTTAGRREGTRRDEAVGDPSAARAFRAVAGLPHGARVVLERDAAGRCVFLEKGGDRLRCAVHRRLGEDALPSACRQFPRVATLTPLGVSVTLSHYCPTAAAMLFAPVIPRGPGSPGPEGSAGPAYPSSHDPDGLRLVNNQPSDRPVSGGLRGGPPASRHSGRATLGDAVALRIVEDPPAFPSSWPWEGLDAREALPPFVRPGVLMDWPSLERWELFAVSVLAASGQAPEKALDVLAAAAEDARRWTPEAGPFGAFFETVLSSRAPQVGRGGRDPQPRRIPRDPAGRASLGMTWRLVADSVPPRAPLPAAPRGLQRSDARWVAPGWPALGRPVCRWLAAKAFASWLVLQGEGLRTAVLGLRVALAVLRAEAARGCAEAGRVLDADLLREAVRRADLLLVHLADPEALARRLGRCEARSGPA